jgi:hypothetical protein
LNVLTVPLSNARPAGVGQYGAAKLSQDLSLFMTVTFHF